MKVAETENGKPVIASSEAPETAVCPRCKNVVILISRKTMDNGATWYWRHQISQGYECRNGTLGYRN
jgi:hypothetical protein